jgi:hypothetical protein
MATEVQVLVIENGICVASLTTQVSGGRHEFSFSHPIRVDGRHFEGFALEMWIDQAARRVEYKEREANRPHLDLIR